MRGLDVPVDVNVLVGTGSSDDAGVYRLNDETALVQTLDFITPIVDDPYIFGKIAACNSISDVYAMGGIPLTAMNIVCFPTGKFSLDVLQKTLQGGLDVLKDTGVQLLGGHSVDDEEFKYGLSITGTVHPNKILQNHGLKPGDVIIITKPLGTGVISTAVKADAAEDDHIDEFIKTMIQVNNVMADIGDLSFIHACTDITGFGFTGHLREMLAGDQLEIRVDAGHLPLLPGATEYAGLGLIPAGMYRNRDHVGTLCHVGSSVPREIADIAYDPQTSGGLLIAVAENDARPLLEHLHRGGAEHARVVATCHKSDTPAIKLS